MPTSTRKKTPVLWRFSGEYVKLRFHVVGADDPVRPPEMPVFTEIRCKFTTFQWADVGIGPYKRPRKTPDFEGGQGRPPLQKASQNATIFCFAP